MSEQPEIQIKRFTASRGLVWLTGSWALFKRQPVRLLLISLFLQVFFGFSQAGALGVLVILCMPVLSAGMLHAFYMVENGEKPLLSVLFLPFTVKKNVVRLVLLGALVLVTGLLLVSLLLSGQVVNIDVDVMTRIEQGDIEAVKLLDPQLLKSAVIAMAIAATLSGTISYFSVPLIWFREQSIGRAIAIGLKALTRNWQPLLVVGLLLGLLAVPIILLFGSFYLSAMSEGTGSFPMAFLVLLLGPVFQVFLFATQYLAFRDIFDLQVVANKASNSGNQLIA